MLSRRKPLIEKELADTANNWAFSDDKVEDDTDTLVDPQYLPHSDEDYKKMKKISDRTKNY